MQRKTKSFPGSVIVFDKGALCGLPRKTFRHQCFSVVAQATPKIRPRPAHDRTTEASARVNDRFPGSILVFDKRAVCKFTSLPTKAFPPKQGCGCASNAQDLLLTSKRAIFKQKNSKE